jgi:hypothetical protein
MGWADRGIMGFEENLANARRLADCTDLLLQADADTGYGNALNVYFVVRAFGPFVSADWGRAPRRSHRAPGWTPSSRGADAMIQADCAALRKPRASTLHLRASTLPWRVYAGRPIHALYNAATYATRGRGP